jgi:hypothetical protein
MARPLRLQFEGRCTTSREAARGRRSFATPRTGRSFPSPAGGDQEMGRSCYCPPAIIPPLLSRPGGGAPRMRDLNGGTRSGSTGATTGAGTSSRDVTARGPGGQADPPEELHRYIVLNPVREARERAADWRCEQLPKQIADPERAPEWLETDWTLEPVLGFYGWRPGRFQRSVPGGEGLRAKSRRSTGGPTREQGLLDRMQEMAGSRRPGDDEIPGVSASPRSGSSSRRFAASGPRVGREGRAAGASPRGRTTRRPRSTSPENSPAGGRETARSSAQARPRQQHRGPIDAEPNSTLARRTWIAT